MPSFAEPFDDPAPWSGPSTGRCAWKVADGVLRLEVRSPGPREKDDEGCVVSRALPAMTGWVRVRCQVHGEGLAQTEEAVEGPGGLFLTVDTFGTWAGAAFEPGDTAHDAVVHLPAGEARILVKLRSAGVVVLDDLRVETVALEPLTVDIPVAEPVPSALDGLDDLRSGRAPRDEGKLSDVVGPENLVRTRFGVRPLLSLAVHESAVALRAGGAVSHRWWTAAPLPVQLGGETTLRATAPAGGATGYRFELTSLHGPWFGPVGLRIGPLARADREVWGGDELPSAFGLGGAADVLLDAGPIAAWVEAAPSWTVAGTRPSGTALDGRAGIGVTAGRWDVSLELAAHFAGVGPVVDGGVGLGVRLP